ncbi:MAG: type II toxin-antitoxin system VapC family toxin [Chloroflexi bacterium]|nr:type II toxin-antitoxin system VapC family toxin [Chloroflexota bacterium]
MDAFVVADSFLDLDAELYSVAAIELLSRGRARGLAPPNWQSEVRSALLEFARDKRLPEGETVKGNLDLLSDLPIDTDQEEDAQTAMDLCLTHNLPYRSGRYLELARRRGVQLATLDADLERAARAEGVDVFHAY